MSNIYEIVDATNDEMYFTLGVWILKEQAIKELEECKYPDELGLLGGHEEYVRVEVRERELGWSEMGKVVHVVEWRQEYREAEDTYVWVKG